MAFGEDLRPVPWHGGPNPVFPHGKTRGPRGEANPGARARTAVDTDRPQGIHALRDGERCQVPASTDPGRKEEGSLFRQRTGIWSAVPPKESVLAGRLG